MAQVRPKREHLRNATFKVELTKIGAAAANSLKARQSEDG